MSQGLVDVHAHFFPRALLEWVRRGNHGLSLSRGVSATGPVLQFPAGQHSRPFFAALLDREARLSWLDTRGLEEQWVGPWLDAVGYTLPPAEGAVWSRRHNEEMVAALAETPALRPLATVPLQDGALAAAELIYAIKQLGMGAVMIGTEIPDRSLSDPSFEPFFAAAVELDVPVFLHPGGVSPQVARGPSAARFLVEYPFATTVAFLDLLLGGVFARHPRLSLILAHGGGTLLSQLPRIRHGLQRLPELNAGMIDLDLALSRCWFDLVIYSQQELDQLVRIVPRERWLLGSDAPFALGLDDPVAQLRELIDDAEPLLAQLGGQARQLLARPTSGLSIGMRR